MQQSYHKKGSSEPFFHVAFSDQTSADNGSAWSMTNPKSEFLNPKQILMFKIQNINDMPLFGAFNI
jgi:hypothetical protein